MKQRRLLCVDWQDSRQPVSGWQWARGIALAPPVKCVSVGFVVQHDRSMIVLAPNIGDLDSHDDQQLSGLITIPRRAVTRIRTLAI